MWSECSQIRSNMGLKFGYSMVMSRYWINSGLTLTGLPGKPTIDLGYQATRVQFPWQRRIWTNMKPHTVAYLLFRTWSLYLFVSCWYISRLGSLITRRWLFRQKSIKLWWNFYYYLSDARKQATTTTLATTIHDQKYLNITLGTFN